VTAIRPDSEASRSFCSGERLNRLGPIAESYEDLQSLPLLMQVMDEPPVPPRGSPAQAVRALFQACEVAVVNMELLARRSQHFATARDVPALARNLRWVLAFAKVWADLSWRIGDVAPLASASESAGLRVSDSSNWHRLASAEAELEPLLRDLLGAPASTDVALADELVRDLLLHVMLERTALEYGRVGDCLAQSYDETIRPEGIRRVVLERSLKGETAFAQFRAAHQIPEILIATVNDHLDVAVRALRDGEAAGARGRLRRAERLLDAAVNVMSVLVENLVMSDYHAIRENLGLTSGSHSFGIHFTLMQTRYPALRDAVGALGQEPAAGEEADLVTVTRSIGRHLDRWRMAHINLPRANLGQPASDDVGVRSLIGAPDAVRTVTRMRAAARDLDDLNPAARSAPPVDPTGDEPTLVRLERWLLDAGAARTQAAFPDVQSRSGYFSGRPRRRAPQPPADGALDGEP
jgi:hypothetical protein